MNFLKKIKDLGPGMLVTAAFIGPGTITTCTLTGANFGFALLWGLVFSIIATIVLQEMSARLGIIGKLGLGEALRKQFNNPIAKYGAIILVLSAILIGNAAYETGNILGASLGMIEISGIEKINIGNHSFSIWGPIIGLCAFLILQLGTYKSLERIIITLVMVMSVSFITTAFIIQPNFLNIFKGLFTPTIPSEAIYMLIGLIGTTVVPYNLFLHASTVQEKWNKSSDIPKARTDLFFSVILGALISMAIVITSASAFYGTEKEIKGAADLASQLKPLLGNWAGIFMSVGLFAAGISSAITAPLAAAYATSGILGFKSDLTSIKFKLVWQFILLIGIIFSAIGYSPIKVIVFAQFTNGILLPFIAIYLLIIMNSSKVLGNYKNKITQNIIGFVVILVMVALGAKSIIYVLGII